MCHDSSSRYPDLGNPHFWEQFDLSLLRCPQNPLAFRALCQKLSPVILITSQRWIEIQPPTAVTQLTSQGVLVLIALEEDDPDATEKFLRLGCRGVLGPGLTAAQLTRAIRATLAGELWAPRLVVSSMLTRMLSVGTLRDEGALTPQERRILELVQKGHNNSEIAATLFISRETVRWHKRRLNRKIAAEKTRRAPGELRKRPLSTSPLMLESSVQNA